MRLLQLFALRLLPFALRLLLFALRLLLFALCFGTLSLHHPLRWHLYRSLRRSLRRWSWHAAVRQPHRLYAQRQSAHDVSVQQLR